jgi:hypothetical protein
MTHEPNRPIGQKQAILGRLAAGEWLDGVFAWFEF